jgi:hypothetical protein
MNGANWAGDYYCGEYQPVITSYDYDALVNESGDCTVKCSMIRQALQTLLPGPAPPPIPPPSPKVRLPSTSPLFSSVHCLFARVPEGVQGAYGPVVLSQSARLLDRSVLAALSPAPVQAAVPLTFEALVSPYGFCLYQSSLVGPLQGYALAIQGIADRSGFASRPWPLAGRHSVWSRPV